MYTPSYLKILDPPQSINSLKGKFSSGIEGALTSTLNHDFNWKQLSEMILHFFSFEDFKVYLSNIDSETAENIKRDFEFWAWASHLL